MKEPIKKTNLDGERDEKGRFRPGWRGNPKARGRPPNELSITNIQRQMLNEPCPYANGKTWAQWLAKRGMELAGENPRYYCEIMDRLEGKVTQPIEGQIKGDYTFVIGKGYANGNDSLQPDKQDTE